MAAVNSNMFQVGVRYDRKDKADGACLTTLPLNLIALVVSLVEDPGDLARMCRTCRLLNYMAIPHLYRNVTLTSYDRIRYRGELPEGWGYGSPFSMGINTLITRAHASSLVQSLTLRGDWNEPELEEYSKIGRVPDATMMLNTSVRAALERMKNLESFSWELNTKMMETVYTGLSGLPKLTSMSIRFLSSRYPRPIYVIPAMPHLRSLRVTNIDPLCYPDDISTLLAKSPKLEVVKLHWSPRMRENQELSVVAHDYFRQCFMDKSPLKLKKVAFHNLFSRFTSDLTEAIDISLLEEWTFLLGCSEDSLCQLSFVDKSWSTSRPSAIKMPNLELVRHDAVSKDFCDFFLSSIKGLKKLYFVNPLRSVESKPSIQEARDYGTVHSLDAGNRVSSNLNLSTMIQNGATITPPSPRSPASGTVQYQHLLETYFNCVLTNHGATLRHLVLPARLRLSSAALARLVHVCPNLEQLSLALESSTFDVFSLIIPFLRNLQAVRILAPSFERSQPIARTHSNSPIPPQISSTFETIDANDDIFSEIISMITADRDRAGRLKMVGLGWKAWELGDFYHVPAPVTTPPVSGMDDLQPADDGGSTANTPTDGQGPPIPISERTPKDPFQRLNPVNAKFTSHTMKTPKSTLGKRLRDELPPPSLPDVLRSSLLTEPDNLRDTLASGHKVVWRRRVQRVGWEVLKNWEIWALDSQDV